MLTSKLYVVRSCQDKRTQAIWAEVAGFIEKEQYTKVLKALAKCTLMRNVVRRVPAGAREVPFPSVPVDDVWLLISLGLALHLALASRPLCLPHAVTDADAENADVIKCRSVALIHLNKVWPKRTNQGSNSLLRDVLRCPLRCRDFPLVAVRRRPFTSWNAKRHAV